MVRFIPRGSSKKCKEGWNLYLLEGKCSTENDTDSIFN